MKTCKQDMLINQLEQVPVIGLCGSSGAGKTTLIEALIPKFVHNGLRVAVVKHGAHNVVIDRPGKDSDRFFCAGADVSLFGDECFTRWHRKEDFILFVIQLASQYDLVLVEGHASTPVPKIWLLGQGFAAPPENQGYVLQSLKREEATVEHLYALLQRFMQQKIEQAPVYGCVLIGGKSSRMGSPKHLLVNKGKTWLENAITKLASIASKVVISGKGEIPDSLAGYPHIPDAPGLAGPLAGILAVMRWQPRASWLVMACDLPDAQQQSLEWLLQCRKPGVWAVLPDLFGNGRIDPLLAWYDSRCKTSLEELGTAGELRISQLAGQQGVCHPSPPVFLHSSWRNVNTPEELQADGKGRE